MRWHRAWILPISAVAATGLGAAAAQAPDLATTLARIGERVEQYYGQARSIVCRETVQLQPLRYDLTWDGSHVRKLVYELRVAWEASAEGKAPEASVLRELVSVDGRPPKAGEEPECMDPKAVSPEPLAMLLASRQHEFVFTWVGAKRSRGGSTITLDFKSLKREPPDVTWKEGCANVELPGWWRGRVWVDQESAVVMRLDEHLTAAVELRVPKAYSRSWTSLSPTIDRLDSSTRYHAVTFRDPEETVMLPESIETLQGGHTRLRTTRTFSDYRRFVTDARIVGVPEAR